MADQNTTNYGFIKPEIGASEDTWGEKLNSNWDDADTAIKSLEDGKVNNTGNESIAGVKTFSDGIIGGVTGNVTGNLTGNVAGNLTGDVIGNVTGNLNGLVTGDSTIIRTTGGQTISGDLTVTGTFIETSDKRLKENVSTISDALDIVGSMRGVYYNKIATPERREIGFIAQEVEQSIGELVEESEGGYKAVSYGRTVALLVEAIKELKAEVEYLKLQN